MIRRRRCNKPINLLRVFFLLVLLSGAGSAHAQTFGNEWINYSQKYYRIPVTRPGVYRIFQSALVNAGLPVNSGLDPRNLQIFYRGREIPLYISTESDGFFGAGDTLEFFAEGNNGWLDTALYVDPSGDMPSPYYSMFNDTSFYYLTYNNSTSNLRYIRETDNNFGAYASAPYYNYIADQGWLQDYYEGEIFVGGQLSPEYTRGEGYGIVVSNAYTYTGDWNSAPLAGLRTTMYTGGPVASFWLNLTSGSNPNPNSSVSIPTDHHHQVRLAGNLVTDTTIDGHGLYKRFYTVNASVLAGSTTPFQVDFLSTFSASTRNGLMYYKFKLPQQFNLGGRSSQFLYLPDAIAQSKSRLDITNFNNGGSRVRLYDLTNRRRIEVYPNGPGFQALVPNSGGEKKLYITSDAQVVDVGAIYPVSTHPGHYAMFRDFRNQLRDYNYLIVTSSELWEPATEYNTYRQQTGFQSMLMDIRELEDQFSYGIPKHPMAIRNFLRMSTSVWSTRPEYMFIIGKGLKPTFTRFSTTLYEQTHVPGIGVPSSDNVYGFNLDGSGKQDVMVGRLAAANEQDVYDYYQKIRDYEDNLPDIWMKNVLHLGGGASLWEQQQLQGYLNGYKSTIEDTLYGGNVFSFFKQSTQPYPITVSDSIRNLVNLTGISLMTIFGHGSGQGFDQNIEEPEDLTNEGKYPLVVVNSCLSGDIFQTTPLISERYVLADRRGAIGFIGSTSQALSTFLAYVTDSLYRNIALRDYGAPVGRALRNAITENANLQNYYSLLRMTALDMQFHGDPGIRFNSYLQPDLEMLEANVSFDPLIVTSEIDSFDMEIIVNNLGRAITSPYLVTLTRNFPAAGVPDTTYYILRNSIYYKDTLRVTLPVDIVKSFGENLFTITADPLNAYTELSELNNSITVRLNISSSAIIPVYPFEYQVVPRDTITLKASTGDPFAPLRTYKFQVDTTDLFNSPFLRDTVIQSIGGVVRWRLPFQLDVITSDSTVFFWRTGVDSAGTGNFNQWKESSFQYIPGKYGWGQDHFFQYKKNDYLYINDNRNTRQFEFVPNFEELHCSTRPCGTIGDPNNFNTRYTINGVVQEEGGCTTTPAMIVAIIDPLTLEPWQTNYAGANPNHDFGNTLCRSRVENYFFFFLSDPTDRAGLENLLSSNVIPDGHYVLAYTWWQGTFNNPAEWPQTLVDAFTNLGANGVQTLVDSAWSRPYIFYTRKGYPATTQEVIGGTNCENIEFTTVLQNDWVFGTVTSPLIGPAQEWGSFHWDTYSIDSNPANDNSYVNIIGVKANGQQEIVVPNVPITTTDILNLSSLVDASTYPYLKLFMFTRDDSTQTPAQLHHWHVLYEGVPEAALNPALAYSFYADSLSQGETMTISTAVENIGDYDMDSLLIRFFVVDANNQVHDFFHKKDSLRIGEVIRDTFKLNTGNYVGLNSIWVEANPINHPEHQLEQFHFNNIGQKVFNVGGDKINPLLDVTFDGVHIMDGDIVSARPEIVIQLKDENKFLLLNDTADFELYLKYPNQSNAVKLNFGLPEITFIPATNQDNLCRIEYLPDFTAEDGIYELLVRARDRSNNISGYGNGDYDYNIRFEVVNHSTVTNVLNYPNPFSTSTQFVFTLTGSELPTEFTIQILTISGVVVREITVDELGPIHIGRNITEYRWDGRDEFGDLLATGVYLYRVIAKLNGEDMDRSNTSADKYFRNGFGKMYIMR